jgi:hypothetical protein
MKKIIAVTLLALILLGAVSMVSADSPPPHHWHYITLANGRVVEVGPDVCNNPHTHEGWHTFHAKMHLGMPRDVLHITTVLCP